MHPLVVRSGRLGRAWHPGRIAGYMTHGMNDDFGFRGLIKHEIGIGSVGRRWMIGLSVRVPIWG